MALCVVVIKYQLCYRRVPPRRCYLSTSLQAVTVPNAVVYPKKRFNRVTLFCLCYFLSSLVFYGWL